MVAWFGLVLFPLNKVPLVFINHGEGYSVEIRSRGSRKANRLPSSQVFKYMQTYLLAWGLNLSLSQNILAVWTILTLACSLAQYWNKPFPRRGNAGELGGAPCSASVILPRSV